MNKTAKILISLVTIGVTGTLAWMAYNKFIKNQPALGGGTTAGALTPDAPLPVIDLAKPLEQQVNAKDLANIAASASNAIAAGTPLSDLQKAGLRPGAVQMVQNSAMKAAGGRGFTGFAFNDITF